MPALILIAAILGVTVLAIYGSMSASASATGSAPAASGDSTGDSSMAGSDQVPTSQGGSDDPVSIALPVIQKFEGFVGHAYEDPPGSGKFSIGYGHQIRANESYNSASTISESEAHDILRVDVGAAWTCVYQNVTAPCSPGQYAALISFCFNVGCGAFKKSAVLASVNKGDDPSSVGGVWEGDIITAGGITNQGLIERRAQEAQLYQG